MTHTKLSQLQTDIVRVKVTMYSEVSPLDSGVGDVAPAPFEETWRAARLIEDRTPYRLSVREVAFQLESFNNLLIFCDAVVENARPRPAVQPAGIGPTAPTGLSPAPFGALFAPAYGVTNEVVRMTLSSPLLVYVGLSEAIAGALVVLVRRVNAARRAWVETNLATRRWQWDNELEAERINLQREIVELTRDTLREHGAELFDTPAGDRMVQLALTGLANVADVEPVDDEEMDR